MEITATRGTWLIGNGVHGDTRICTWKRQVIGSLIPDKVCVSTKRTRVKNKPFKTGFLTGCALFLPRLAVEEIGFLDEAFFLYYEDADYSERARAKGFSLYVIPNAKVTHSEESIHNPKKTYHLVFSGLLFFSKHTKGLFSFYQAIYGILRRQKNRWDLFRGKPLAREVSRAYSEFYAKKPSFFFNNLRKL